MDRDDRSFPPELQDRAADADEKQDLKQIWSELRRTDEERAASYDVDAAWNQLAERLGLERSPSSPDADAASEKEAGGDRPPRPPRRTTSSRRRWKRTALLAAVVVMCAVGLGAWWWAQPVTIATTAGTQKTVPLPDGSTVTLNGETTLTHPRGFRALPLVGPMRRRVRVQGEAFFSVQAREQPFTVETSNAQVEVLGTDFNVRARTQQGTPETYVAVVSGQVRVSPRRPSPGDASESVVLEDAGQTSRVTGRDGVPLPPETVDLKYLNAWREGGFALREASVPTILRELEHRFGTSLDLRAPVAETDTMTLHYARDVQLEDILRDICLIQNLKYQESSQGYVLVRD